MADEEVNFERVTKIYREESSKKTLSRLEPDFYRKVATYVRALEAKAAEEVLKGPNSAKAMLLQDELRKVLKKREQIVQYRQRKIALLAASKANGGEADVSGLAAPEADVFEQVLGSLSQARQVAFGATPAPAPAAPPPAPPAASPALPPATPAAPAVLIVLTATERRILDLLAAGPLTQSEIAARLDVTRQAANAHVKALQRKGVIDLRFDGRKWRAVLGPGAPRV